MTQIFTPQGTSVPVTVLEADTCRVVQRKTVGVDG
jgi:ribosomal protein L3